MDSLVGDLLCPKPHRMLGEEFVKFEAVGLEPPVERNQDALVPLRVEARRLSLGLRAVGTTGHQGESAILTKFRSVGFPRWPRSAYASRATTTVLALSKGTWTSTPLSESNASIDFPITAHSS